MRVWLTLGLLCTVEAFAAPAALEWDPADHGSEMTANARSVTRNSASGAPWQTARSRAFQTSGVRTAEIAIDRMGSGVMIGVANARASVAMPLGSDGDSIGYWSTGATSVNGGLVSGLPPFTQGDVIGVMADLDTKNVRFRKNAGEWSSPVSIASIGPDVYLCAAMFVGDGSPISLRVVSDTWNDFTEPTINIVAVGDSITLTGGVLRSYVIRLKDELLLSRRHLAQVQQLAANGASWNYAWYGSGYPNTLLQDGPVRVDPARSRLPDWLVLFAGTNGIAIAGHSATDEYTGLRDYVRARTSAGWRASQIVVCTMLPRSGVPESVRSTYNDLIISDPAGLGYKVARLDRDSMLETMNAANYPDGVHPSEALHARIARIIAELIPETVGVNPLTRE